MPFWCCTLVAAVAAAVVSSSRETQGPHKSVNCISFLRSQFHGVTRARFVQHVPSREHIPKRVHKSALANGKWRFSCEKACVAWVNIKTIVNDSGELLMAVVVHNVLENGSAGCIRFYICYWAICSEFAACLQRTTWLVCVHLDRDLHRINLYEPEWAQREREKIQSKSKSDYKVAECGARESAAHFVRRDLDVAGVVFRIKFIIICVINAIKIDPMRE